MRGLKLLVIYCPSLFRNSYHPLAGIFISSDTPKERDPMKSFLVVRSQSQTSTDNRRSLSVGFNLLKKDRNGGVVNTEIKMSTLESKLNAHKDPPVNQGVKLTT